MQQLSKEKALQALGYFACLVVLWIRLDDYGASEFGGGWLTGPLFRMADGGGLLFLVAMPLTFFARRLAAVSALVAAFLCLPFYLYIVMPGPYRWIFKIQPHFMNDQAFYWNSWAFAGLISLMFAATLSLRAFSTIKAGK